MLSGDLGAGKTTLVRGIVSGIDGTQADEVSSPTFTLIHDYGADVFHIDLYRLDDEREIASLGLEDIFDHARLVLIEWGEKLGSRAPAPRTEIKIELTGDNERLIHVTSRNCMLPGLAQLESTPEIFRVLFDGLTEEEAQWKPAADRWSIAEVMEHLSHVEGHGFRSRIDQMMEEEAPEIKEYNQETFAAAGQYSGRNIEDSFDHWEDQRETNVEYLRSLTSDCLQRRGLHEKFGVITIADLLNEWAFHDLGHVRQVIELLRSFRYFPRLGPFQSIYHVSP